MQGHGTRWLVVGLAMAAIALLGFAWQRQAAGPAVADANVAPARAGTSQPSVPVPAPSARAARQIFPSVDKEMPVGAQVERLLATRDPQQAYAAYFLISACAMFNARNDFDIVDAKLHVRRAMSAQEKQQVADMCGGMTERERLARLDYLAIAVKAGVPGAAWTFATEGPFGDPSALKTRPDDPLVREWKATAAAQLAQAAEAGDDLALQVWGLQNLSGSDLGDKQPVQGYGYLLAYGMLQAERFGADAQGARMYASGSPMMNAMGAHLTPEQRAVAMAEARRIAGNVKARRERGAAGPAARSS